LWGGPDNVYVDADMGDRAKADAALAQAAHVVRLQTTVNRVTGVPMEPRSANVQYDAATDSYTMYCGGDNSVRTKRDLAAVRGVPPDKVRVLARDVGGNFGTRNWFYPEYGIAGWAAKRVGRPVKWTAVRSEAMISDYQGRDLVVDAELGLDANG